MATLCEPQDILEKKRAFLVERLDLKTATLGEKLVEHGLLTDTKLNCIKVVVLFFLIITFGLPFARLFYISGLLI